jgi:uncharacterized protein
MKRIFIMSLVFLGIMAMPLAALDVPPLKGHVNDYAALFSPKMAGFMEKDLAEFEKKESTQIVILTIPSLRGEVLEQYSLKVAEKWKIGRKKLDNGVILLIAKEDRKLRIEVGYGLEGKLTDLWAGRIIDNSIKPFFKKGDYDTGIFNGVQAIKDAVMGEYPGMEQETADKPNIFMNFHLIPVYVVGGFILFILIMILIARKFPGSGSGGSSGSDSYSYSGSSSSDSYSSSSSDSGGSSSGSYSGGGGSFGGGGASGDW